ncbi:DUF6372 family protein [Streptomyces griseocarneus]|uniref:DUF6372 family protein n=1 Tax=Streptomyces griseocarneus TaxID=51201 RepID=UPI001CCA10A4|nr:hypothetical protein [Streptomyces griseocarneus]
MLHLAALFRWEQHETGGCRCLCGPYHLESPGPAVAGGCTAAGEPGLLKRRVLSRAPPSGVLAVDELGLVGMQSQPGFLHPRFDRRPDRGTRCSPPQL